MNKGTLIIEIDKTLRNNFKAYCAGVGSNMTKVILEFIKAKTKYVKDK